jgi:hypothetical protein
LSPPTVTLTHHTEYDEIVLWFGATSICQLSLVQLLAWFDEHSRDNTRLRLVSVYGGWLRPEQLLQAYDARQPITPASSSLSDRQFEWTQLKFLGDDILLRQPG